MSTYDVWHCRVKDERDALRAENERLRAEIASSNVVRANACKSVDRLQAEAAAMRQALQYFVDRVKEGTARSIRTYNMYKDLLNSTAAGAAMLRVVEAAKEWKETGDGNPLEDALDEMERDRHA